MAWKMGPRRPSGWGGKSAAPKAPATEAEKAQRRAKLASIKALNENRIHIFRELLNQQGLPQPRTEYQFWPGRKFAFDLCWPELRLALEMEGGVATGGRHTQVGGFLKDMEKYNEASALGYRVIRCVPSELATMATVTLVRRCLGL